MVSYYSSVTPVIRNHPVYMQYSTHKELKTDNSPNQVVCSLTQTHTQNIHSQDRPCLTHQTTSTSNGYMTLNSPTSHPYIAHDTQDDHHQTHVIPHITGQTQLLLVVNSQLWDPC